MYEHTQLVWWPRVVAIIAAIICAVSLIQVTDVTLGFVWLFAGACALAAGFVFSSLTIKVRDGRLEWHFGLGAWHITTKTSDIASVSVVHNPWWYGWGIHYTPYGWLYNVWGFTAVEIIQKNGTRYRIGSNDAQALARVLTSAI